ncbi:MAG: hypothetical protein WBB85_04020 [Albidovulum sp.]
MKPKSSAPVLGVHAPAPRLSFAALALVTTGLSLAFLTMLAGFTIAASIF